MVVAVVAKVRVVVLAREAVVTVAAARAKMAAARAKVAAARAGAWARAAVAREHQLLGERMLRAGRDVRVVARVRRHPLARVGATGSGHVGLYVAVIGLVRGLLAARAPHIHDAAAVPAGTSPPNYKSPKISRPVGTLLMHQPIEYHSILSIDGGRHGSRTRVLPAV